MFEKKEIVIFGLRAVLHQVREGINVELVGNTESRDTLDGMAKQLTDVFGGNFETPDHPGTSHIRLIFIRRERNDLVEFVNELQSKGF